MSVTVSTRLDAAEHFTEPRCEPRSAARRLFVQFNLVELIGLVDKSLEMLLVLMVGHRPRFDVVAAVHHKPHRAPDNKPGAVVEHVSRLRGSSSRQ
jgi:hypothetical protein